LPSIAATVPKSGFNLKFCPVLLTTLIRSTVGLKSKPNVVPVKEGTKVVPTTVNSCVYRKESALIRDSI
jgi:hypothetical protein